MAEGTMKLLSAGTFTAIGLIGSNTNAGKKLLNLLVENESNLSPVAGKVAESTAAALGVQQIAEAAAVATAGANLAGAAMSFAGIGFICRGIYNRFFSLRADVQEIKGNVEEIKSNVEEVKGSVSQIKNGVEQVKRDVEKVEGSVSEIKTDVQNGVNQLSQATESVREELKQEIDRQCDVINDFTESIGNLTNIHSSSLHKVQGELTAISRSLGDQATLQVQTGRDVSELKSDIQKYTSQFDEMKAESSRRYETMESKMSSMDLSISDNFEKLFKFLSGGKHHTVAEATDILNSISTAEAAEAIDLASKALSSTL